MFSVFVQELEVVFRLLIFSFLSDGDLIMCFGFLEESHFGFDRAQPNGTILFNTTTLGFASQEKRDAALAKWRAYRAEAAAKQ